MDVGLIVRSAQTAPDAATASAALSLLTPLALKAPSAALQHVLQVVQLAGGAALASSDDATSAAISGALSAVAAAWLASGKPVPLLWSALLDVLPNVAAHRHAPLLTTLLSSLPTEDGLLPLSMLVLQRSAAPGAEASQGAETGMAEGNAKGVPARGAAAATDGDWHVDLLSRVYAALPVPQRLATLAALLEASLASSDAATTSGNATVAATAAAHSSVPRLAVLFATRQVNTLAATATAAGAAPDAQASFQAIVLHALGHLRLLSQAGSRTGSQAGLVGGAKQRVARAHAAALDGVNALLRALQKVTHAAAFLSTLVSVMGDGSDGVRRVSLRLFTASCGKVPDALADLVRGSFLCLYSAYRIA